MKKLLCLIIMLCALVIPVTSLAAEKNVLIRIEDKDVSDYLSIPDVDEINVYVKEIDDGTVYKFPIKRENGYFMGEFPLPDGRYETVPAENPAYLSDQVLEIPNAENKYEFNCTITAYDGEVIEETTPDNKSENIETPVEKPEEKGFSLRYSQIVTIIAIIICVFIFFFAKRRKKKME